MKYYVYTPVDGEEDGKFSGLSLAEAKNRARQASANLRDAGLPIEDTAALVNTNDDQCVTVWSCTGETCGK